MIAKRIAGALRMLEHGVQHGRCRNAAERADEGPVGIAGAADARTAAPRGAGERGRFIKRVHRPASARSSGARDIRHRGDRNQDRAAGRDQLLASAPRSANSSAWAEDLAPSGFDDAPRATNASPVGRRQAVDRDVRRHARGRSSVKAAKPQAVSIMPPIIAACRKPAYWPEIRRAMASFSSAPTVAGASDLEAGPDG